MIQFTELSWAQLLLIEIGAIFQLVALYTFLKDSSRQRGYSHRKEKTDGGLNKTSRHSSSAIPTRFVPRQQHWNQQNGLSTLKPVSAAKTGRVKFVQHFKAEKQEEQFIPSSRW